jgi:hypothetical protein
MKTLLKSESNMPVLREWDLIIDADQVLRGQGAEPQAIRSRSPNLVKLAERAIAEATSVLDPQLLHRRMKVEAIVHERIILEGGAEMRGRLLAQHFAPASEVIIILCTIGAALERKVSEVMRTDMVYALALDGLGSAGAEVLANAACRRFELQAEVQGMETSIPLSPGMIDWSVEEGQPQIFNLLPAEEIGMSITPSYVMLPRKSLSMVIGVGQKMTQKGTTCDYCTMRETCRYQDHYLPVIR